MDVLGLFIYNHTTTDVDYILAAITRIVYNCLKVCHTQTNTHTHTHTPLGLSQVCVPIPPLSPLIC